MQSTSGKNGADGGYNDEPAAVAGPGGIALGGNIANIMGFTGGTGGRAGDQRTAPYPGDNNGAAAGGLSTNAYAGAAGGGGARVPGSEYCRYVDDNMAAKYKGGDGGKWATGVSAAQNGKAGSSIPTPVPGASMIISGAGSGGGGARAGSTNAGKPGGTGQGGVVIIEQANESEI